MDLSGRLRAADEEKLDEKVTMGNDSRRIGPSCSLKIPIYESCDIDIR